eukprot:gene17156-20403_t
MGRGGGPKRRRTSSIVLVAQGAGLLKRTQKHPYDKAGSNDTEYSIREIKNHRESYGVIQYLISWEGFTDADDTWEPAEHLTGEEHTIQAYRDAQAAKDAAAEAENATAREARRQRREEANPEASDLVDANQGKSKRRSPIWQFFWVVMDEGDKVTHTVCKQCGEDSERVAYPGNTTNLRSHIAHVHKDVYCKLCIEEKNTTTGIRLL